MSVAELKEKLIHQIASSDDIGLLEDISRLIEVELGHEKVFRLNEAQISAIVEARQQINSGQFLSHDDAEKDIDEWLKK